MPVAVLEGKSVFETEDVARAYIANCDKKFAARVGEITERLMGDRNLKMIGLSGPSCSGKTTAAKILINRLCAEGKQVHLISVDNFFREQLRERTVAEAASAQTIDFDSIDALDLPLFEDFMWNLMQKGKAQMPDFNIGASRREGWKTVECTGESDIFLIEGIQVVYPEIRRCLNQYPYRSLFIQVERSLSVGGVLYAPEDIRFLRRLVRDYYFRESPAAFTFFTWESVRANEIRNILPYADDCDEKMDSLMGYEIGMLRPHLEKILRELPAGSPYLDRANEILRRIGDVQSLRGAWLAEQSLYHEFVGNL